ncbi:hypothetical protein Tco_0250493 [Tanacetum coccineum]
MVDSSIVPVVDPVPSAGDTEAFKTDESASTPPRSPRTKVPFSQTRLRRAQKTVKLKPHMSTSIKARIAKHVAASTPPLPVSSPPLPLPSPLTTSPTDKRDCFTTPASGLEVGESSAAAAARQLGPTLEADLRRDMVREMGYKITDTWNEIDTKEFQEFSYKGHVRMLEAQVATLTAQTTSLQTQLTTSLGHIQTLEARDPEPQDEPAEKMPPKKRTTRTSPATTTTTSTPMTDAQIQALIERGMAAALAECDADRSRNGDDSHDSGTGRGR